MDTAEIGVLIAGITLITWTLWFFLGGKSEETRPSSDAANYACPMHPWITSTDPTANCTICGMKLVRRE